MWEVKEFQTREQMNSFIEKCRNRIQWEEVFIDNGYAIEYRHLRTL